MTALAAAYRAERDLLDALERGDLSGRRAADRILRAIGREPAAAAACCSIVPPAPSLSS